MGCSIGFCTCNITGVCSHSAQQHDEHKKFFQVLRKQIHPNLDDRNIWELDGFFHTEKHWFIGSKMIRSRTMAICSVLDSSASIPGWLFSHGSNGMEYDFPTLYILVVGLSCPAAGGFFHCTDEGSWKSKWLNQHLGFHWCLGLGKKWLHLKSSYQALTKGDLAVLRHQNLNWFGLHIPGEEIDSGDSSQDGSSVVPHGLEDTRVATMLSIQHIILSLLYIILHNVIVCAHGYVHACKISETKKMYLRSIQCLRGKGGNNMNL